MKKKLLTIVSIVAVLACLVATFVFMNINQENDVSLGLQFNGSIIELPIEIGRLEEEKGIRVISIEDIYYETGDIYTPMGYVIDGGYPIEAKIRADRENGDKVIGISFFDIDSPFSVNDITIGSSVEDIINASNSLLDYSKEEILELSEGDKIIEYTFENYIVNIELSNGEASRINVECKENLYVS